MNDSNNAQTPDENKYPWERSPLEIKIRATNDAQILGEEGDDYLVVFYEEDMTPVEARVEKKQFEGHPGNPRPGSYFVLVVYHDLKIDPEPNKNSVIAAPWPIPRNWNKELRKTEE